MTDLLVRFIENSGPILIQTFQLLILRSLTTIFCRRRKTFSSSFISYLSVFFFHKHLPHPSISLFQISPKVIQKQVNLGKHYCIDYVYWSYKLIIAVQANSKRTCEIKENDAMNSTGISAIISCYKKNQPLSTKCWELTTKLWFNMMNWMHYLLNLCSIPTFLVNYYFQYSA